MLAHLWKWEGINLVDIYTQAELAHIVGMPATVVSEALTELEHIGAIYRHKMGQRNRLVVNARLAWLACEATAGERDRAQAEAPELRLVALPASAAPKKRPRRTRARGS